MRANPVGPVAWALCIVALVTASESAQADSAMVVVSDGASPSRGILQNKAEDALRDRGFMVYSRVGVEDGGPTWEQVSRCLGSSPGCMKRLLVAVSVDRLLTLEVKPDEDTEASLFVIGRLFDGESGRRIGTEQRHCQGCTEVAQLGLLVDDLVGELVRPEPGEASQAGAWVQVTTDPTEAQVAINGQDMGVSGRHFPVTPGEHAVVVTKDGYQSARRGISVARAQTAMIHVRLLPQGDATQDVAVSEAGYGTWKWLALGSGVTLGALGGVGIWLDGPRSYDGVRQPDEYTTLAAGIGAAATGAVLLGVAGWMWYREASLGSGVAVTVHSGGAGISITGAF